MVQPTEQLHKDTKTLLQALNPTAEVQATLDNFKRVLDKKNIESKKNIPSDIQAVDKFWIANEFRIKLEESLQKPYEVQQGFSHFEQSQ